MTDILTADAITTGAAYTIAPRAEVTRFAADIGRVLQNGIDRKAGTTCAYCARAATWTVSVADGDRRAVTAIRHAMDRWAAEVWAAGERRPAGQSGRTRGSEGPVVKAGNAHAAPTDAQLAYAARLAGDAGYRDVTAARAAMHGKGRVAPMARQECSSLIDWLLRKTGGA